VKFTNMITARFRESRYLVRKSEVFVKDKTKLAGRVNSNHQQVFILATCCGSPVRRNSVLEELKD